MACLGLPGAAWTQIFSVFRLRKVRDTLKASKLQANFNLIYLPSLSMSQSKFVRLRNPVNAQNILCQFTADNLRGKPGKSGRGCSGLESANQRNSSRFHRGGCARGLYIIAK